MLRSWNHLSWNWTTNWIQWTNQLNPIWLMRGAIQLNQVLVQLNSLWFNWPACWIQWKCGSAVEFNFSLCTQVMLRSWVPLNSIIGQWNSIGSSTELMFVSFCHNSIIYWPFLKIQKPKCLFLSHKSCVITIWKYSFI